jgi:hypothetical protein
MIIGTASAQRKAVSGDMGAGLAGAPAPKRPPSADADQYAPGENGA